MRTAIYTRISQDKKKNGDDEAGEPVGQHGDGLGVQRQEEDCRKLAAQLERDVTRVYSDNDISAYSGKRRPDFEQMLGDMKAGEFDALICWHTDRLYRSMKDLERLIEIAEPARVQIRTVQGGDLDLSTSAGKMIARILGSVARQESDHMSERRVRFNRQKAELGIWQTVHRPFGYTTTGEPLEPEATIVRKAVSDVLAGKSIRRVAIEWNEAGIKTVFGKTWSGPRVRRLLVNPRYAALKVHRGKIVGPGDWEPLIDEDTHRGMVAYLSDPSRKAGSTFERKYQGSGVYRCGACGGPMRSAFPGGKYTARVYACRDGNHVTRLGEPLDDYVSMLVVERLSQPDVHLVLEDGNSVDVAELHTQRAALQARLDELAGMFGEGVIDGSQLRRGTAELRSRVTVVDSQLAEAARTNPVAELLTAGVQIAQRWQETSPDKRGKVIDTLMVVSVLPSPKGTKGFHPEYIDIAWKTP